eukprot:sb/3472821/
MRVRCIRYQAVMEVCVTFLGKFRTQLDSLDASVQSSPDKIESELRKACKTKQPKDERFCWYIGATETSATGMTQVVTKPMSFHKPVEKICGDLYKKDAQICDLKYEKQIDLKTVNIKKLKVKDLRKILEQNGQDCKGCSEKSEFVKKVEAIAREQGRTEL